MIQTSYWQWVMVPENLGVRTCCPLHIKKPNGGLNCKPFNTILAFGATQHEQTTKNASFCTQNEQTTYHCGPNPTIPTDIKMTPPVWTALLNLYI